MIEYENLQKLNQAFVAQYRDKFEAVLTSGWFILGQQVKCFEDDFACYCGTNHCVGVANGLDALILSLKAFDFKPGGEVIVPSNTYIATILSILNCGLKPILVEPDISTYNIDTKRIEESITKNTVAIMVVHLYGKCCEMDVICSIAKKYHLKLVEDCAQAHGAMFKDRRAGSFGDFSAFSFYPTKNLGALGDGGSLNTSSDELAILARKLRNYGSQKKYYNDIIGVNSRLDELQAAFLSVKLNYLDDINTHKRELAASYQANLKDDFIKPQFHKDYFDVFHIYNVRHPKRDELKTFLLKNNVGTEIHYPMAPHKQGAMQGVIDSANFPISEEIHATTLSLPISFSHTEDDISRVIEIMNRF
jgi:dTDP-4-amino-4,6-dideoxygalactose transaminase